MFTFARFQWASPGRGIAHAFDFSEGQNEDAALRGAPISQAKWWSSTCSVPEDGPRGLFGQSNPVVLLLGLLSYVAAGAPGQCRHACTVLQSFPIPRVLVALNPELLAELVPCCWLCL